YTDGPVCSICSKQYDFACAGITEYGFRRLGDRKNSWRCPACKTGSSLSPAATSPVPSQLDKIQERLNQIVFDLVPLKTLVEDVKAIKLEMGDLRASVEMAHNTIGDFTAAFSSMETRVSNVEKVANEIPTLQAEVNRLKQEMEERDQWARANNVEIRGIPQKKNENLYQIAQKIGELSVFNIKKEDISYIARIPTRVPDAEKPIIITFNNRYIKEDLVASARKSNQLRLNNLGFPTTGQFYVNDHLTQKYKILLNKARSAAREKDFRYIWVKHSKIMARKSDTSPIFVIKNEKDLLKIV
ncbi:uncharacterized protein LOC135310000, partial [Plodia interpunctella]|uniref:uncharacterized protein LOC135310000 n=1 Tax=Plodia interpunctella TaxID=58824 RepID=UPI00310193B1